MAKQHWQHKNEIRNNLKNTRSEIQLVMQSSQTTEAAIAGMQQQILESNDGSIHGSHSHKLDEIQNKQNIIEQKLKHLEQQNAAILQNLSNMQITLQSLVTEQKAPKREVQHPASQPISLAHDYDNEGNFQAQYKMPDKFLMQNDVRDPAQQNPVGRCGEMSHSGSILNANADCYVPNAEMEMNNAHPYTHNYSPRYD